MFVGALSLHCLFFQCRVWRVHTPISTKKYELSRLNSTYSCIKIHSLGPTLRSSPRTTFCLLTTCEQADCISPHELVACSMAGKSARKSEGQRGQSRDIKTGQAFKFVGAFSIFALFFAHVFFVVFFFNFFSIFLLPMFCPCNWVSIVLPSSRANQVEPTLEKTRKKNLDKMNCPYKGFGQDDLSV